MALPTASVDRRGTTDNLSHEVIQGGKDVASLGVVGTLHLLIFVRVTFGTVLGGHHDGNQGAFMFEGIQIPLLGRMAIQAVNAILAMLALVPFPVEAWVLGHMAIDAFLTRRCTPIDPSLAGWTSCLGGPVGQQ